MNRPPGAPAAAKCRAGRHSGSDLRSRASGWRSAREDGSRRDPHVVTLVDLDSRPRRRSVEAPQIKRSVGQDRLLHRLGDQTKDLGAVLHRERQVGDIGRGDRNIPAAPVPARAASRIGRAEPESGPRCVASSAKSRGAVTRPAPRPRARWRKLRRLFIEFPAR